VGWDSDSYRRPGETRGKLETRKNGARGFLAGVRLSRRAVMTTNESENGWPASECRRALELAASETDGALTRSSYRRWRRECSGYRPSCSAIVGTLADSWRGSLRRAGLEDRISEGRVVEWGESDVRSALAGVSRLETLSMREYVELASGCDELPSVPIVYRHFDSWESVIDWAGPGERDAERRD
jgi:hypothetical protein